MDNVTQMLNALSDGDASGHTALLETIYGELRTMAAGKMVGERPNHTLQATALVNEAYLRLVGNDQSWENRRHFFGAASEAMRRILVDAARKRTAAKRGSGKQATELNEELHLPAPPDDRILLVHEALDTLEQEDPKKAQIVKLRYFVGLTHQEIAHLLELNEKTVRRHWQAAKLLLYQSIKDAEQD